MKQYIPLLSDDQYAVNRPVISVMSKLVSCAPSIQLDHPNIIKLLSLFKQPSVRSARYNLHRNMGNQKHTPLMMQGRWVYSQSHLRFKKSRGHVQLHHPPMTGSPTRLRWWCPTTANASATIPTCRMCFCWFFPSERFTNSPWNRPKLTETKTGTVIHKQFSIYLVKFQVSLYIWVFPKTGIPQNGWFYNGKSYQKWMIWGGKPPIFGNIQISCG